jgi:hypothetical protein
MAAWNLACNVAAPFITVYLLRQIGYELGTVTTTWAGGQIATALTMAWWGRVSDRLSNKAIQFLFAISFTLGFYVLHRLSRIREGEEHSERTVIQQLVIEASRSIDQLSPIEGLRTVILLPFRRDQRLRPRSGP